MDEDQKPAVEQTEQELKQSPILEKAPPTSHKKRNIILGIIIIAVLAISFGVYYLLFFSAQPSQEQQSENNSDQQTALKPEDIITNIRNSYSSKYTVLENYEDSQPKDGEIAMKVSEIGPIYKYEGYDFYTDSTTGSTLEFKIGPTDPSSDELPRSIDTTIRGEIIDTYLSYELVKKETRGSAELSNQTEVYTGEGLVCTTETPSTKSVSVSASCSLISDYKEMAEKIKPFADALPNLNGSAVLMNLKISDSEASGYQKATLSEYGLDGIGGAVASFYKKGSDSWKYFMSAQNTIPCSYYNTTDIKSAFKGDECWSEADQAMSTVK